MQLFAQNGSHAPDPVQRFSMFLMSLLVLLTFVGTNMQALLWQSSDWLVSTVLPAVVIDLTNDERQDNDRVQLTRNTILDEAAGAKAQHMADNEYFAHFAPDGTTPWQFFNDADYVYAHAGENLAIHFTDSAEVVEAWMQSPTHRKNIVDPKFTEIGVGTARGTFEGYDTVYVVQLFGTPAVPPVTPVEPVAQAREIPQAAVAAEPEVSVVPESTTEPETEPVTTPVEVLAVEAGAQLDAVPAEPVTTAPAESSVLEIESVASESVIESEPTLTTVTSAPEPATTTTPELVADPAPPITTTMVDDVVVVQTELSTSSGLAVATITNPPAAHAGATLASMATRPNLVLQFLYILVASLILISLAYALFMEARRMHFVQVAYSLGLMLVMGGLWYLHSALTSGAVII